MRKEGKENKQIKRVNQKEQIKKIYMIVGIIVFLILLIDQLSKFFVIEHGEITIIQDALVLSVKESNTGTYDENAKMVNIITNLVVLFIIIGIIRNNNQFIKPKIKILLSFALAGGLSNIVDRIMRGNVVEFIQISNIPNFPAFNIADICILIGWISFVASFAHFSSKELTQKGKDK